MRKKAVKEHDACDPYMTTSKAHFRDPKEVNSSETEGETCSCSEEQQCGIKLFSTGEIFFRITRSLPCPKCQNGKPPTENKSADETTTANKSAGETSTENKGETITSTTEKPLKPYEKEFPPLSSTECRGRQSLETPATASLLSPETPNTSNSRGKYMRMTVSTSAGTDMKKWDLVPVLQALRERLAKVQSHSALFHVNPPGSMFVEHRSGDWNWNRPGYIKLPLDSAFVKTDSSGFGFPKKTPRWNLIRDELTKLAFLSLTSCIDPSEVNVGMQIKKAVSEYNMRLARECDFQVLSHPELSHRLRECLPGVVTHALKLQNILATPIPILKRGNPHTLYLTRELACSLLANGFLCTIPDQFGKDLPNFNFNKLFDSSYSEEKSMVKVEKLKCILEYFSQLKKDEDKYNIISYERKCISRYQNWHCSDRRLSELKVNRGLGIEHAEGMLQVDFANRRVGGGVLSEGMVMEEIRFCISPELIVARLFTETLGDDEVLVVTGTKKFSSYSGYSSTFRFAPIQEQRQQLERDHLGREFTQVVAMDAIHFQPSEHWKQYQKTKIDRELHKCYVALVPGKHVTPVATGNWGCGAFNGDPQLKFLIQWIAASHHNRPLVFFTGSASQEMEFSQMADILLKNKIVISHLYRMLVKYECAVPVYSSTCPPLFEYIKWNISKERY